MTEKVLFLDRDGPINIVGPRGFVCDPKHFHFTEGIFRFCRQAMKKDYRIIIITNQTGIGLNDYTEKDMEAVHDHMLQGFAREGVRISDIFFTKKPTSPNRKPSPGMFMLAKEKFELSDQDMFASVAVGDRQKDATAALRAGVGRIVYYQTTKALDNKWRIVHRTPMDLHKELTDLQREFRTLAIFGGLAKACGVSQKPRLLTPNAPNMVVINHYRQFEREL